ncbi:MAG: chromate transporter, partial [Aquabacterium sp.]|nr:chromate transporter [Aquabacterium sp.]
MPDQQIKAQQPTSPTSLWDLFVAFTLLAMQGFGGVLAVAQRELCDRRQWLTQAEFLQLLSTAQVLPGPNVCNLSLMIGDKFFGWRGALVALSGMIAAPLVLLLSLAWALTQAHQVGHWQSTIQDALSGVATVAAGQIIGTVLKLSAPLKEHALGAPLCALLAMAAFLMMTWLHWPLVWILLGLGGSTCLYTYWTLKRRA